MQKLIDLPALITVLAFFLAPGPVLALSEFEIHYTKGIKAHEEGNIGEAQKELSEALAIDTKSPEANYAIGVIYLEQNKHSLALDHFKKAREAGAKSQDIDYQSGLTNYKMGNYPEAERDFKSVAERSGKETLKNDARFYLGKTYEKMGKPELAKVEFAKVKATEPEDLKIKAKRWFLNIYPAFQYDTNVALISKGVVTPPDISGKGSPRLYLTMAGGVIPIYNSKEMMMLTYRCYHGFNLMNNLDNYNISQHSLSFDNTLNHYARETVFRSLFGLEYELSLISNSFNFYSQSVYIKPRQQIIWNKKTLTEIRTGFTIDDYYDSAYPEDDRDAFNLSAGIEQSITLMRKFRSYAAFDYQRNLADGYNFNYNGFSPSIGFEAGPYWRINTISLNFAYIRRDFVDFLPLPRREDNTYLVDLNVGFKFSSMLELYMDNTYIQNESIAGYSYKRYIFSLILGILL